MVGFNCNVTYSFRLSIHVTSNFRAIESKLIIHCLDCSLNITEKKRYKFIKFLHDQLLVQEIDSIEIDGQIKV